MNQLDALAYISRLCRKPDAHKGDAGKVLLIGGSRSMTGALVLAGQGALYSGAGWVQLMMLDSASAGFIPNHPELMVHNAEHWLPQRALETIAPNVVAIGPGLGLSKTAKAWLESCLHWKSPLVVDADGINLLALNPELLQILKNRSAPTCLTPHPGEAARLLGMTNQEVQLNREKGLAKLVELTHAHVVLKGHRSLLAAPKHAALECLAGNPGMAVGGMGDVLTGCVAAIVAQGLQHHLDIWQSISLGVHVHALAGDRLLDQGIGPIGMTPSELAKEIRSVMNQYLSSSTLDD
jgi:hydroxyethylthiazole kinase-like uncharacterized protein yjeF